jgi:multicomponent Na+:H+ antiporter subunit B
MSGSSRELGLPVDEFAPDEPNHRPALAALLAAAVGAVLVTALLGIPREHAPLPVVARYALEVALPQWKFTEPVNEVVYGTRGFDTFGETFLLLAAVVGISTVTRTREARRGFVGEAVAGAREQQEVDESGGSAAGSGAAGGEGSETEAKEAEAGEQGRGRRRELPDDLPLGTPGPESSEAMTVVVRGGVRVVAPILLTAGTYLAIWGYSPGGGFPAGAVVLGVVLLAYVSLGYRKVENVVRPGVVEPIEMAGALAIVLVELLGLFLKGSFSANWLPLAQIETPLSGGVLQAFSWSELVEVATGLTLVVFGLLGMEHDWSPDVAPGEEPAHEQLLGPTDRPGAGEPAPGDEEAA